LSQSQQHEVSEPQQVKFFGWHMWLWWLAIEVRVSRFSSYFYEQQCTGHHTHQTSAVFKKGRLNNRSIFSNGEFYYYSFDLGSTNYIDFYGSNSESCSTPSIDIYFYCYRKNSSLFRCTYKDEKVNFKYTCLYSISK